MDISLDAIIGVVATLAGTILGWILGTISNHVGRIRINISKQKVEFFDKNEYLLSIGTNVGYNNIPERIKISFVMSAYNNYAKSNGINHAGCMLRCGRRKYYLEANLEGISDFTNMNPYEYHETGIYHMSNVNIPTEAEAAIKMKKKDIRYILFIKLIMVLLSIRRKLKKKNNATNHQYSVVGIFLQKMRWCTIKPIEFPEQNIVFVANGCEDLPACKLDNEKGGSSEVISCWELEKNDIRLILKQITGGEIPKIYLSCLGGQPPVWLHCGSPFVKESE